MVEIFGRNTTYSSIYKNRGKFIQVERFRSQIIKLFYKCTTRELSALHTIRKPQRNMDETSIAEKTVSLRNTTKTMLHTIRGSSKVLHQSLLLQFTLKIPLSLSWRLLTWQNKTHRVPQNATKHHLHTICSAYPFHCFIPVSLWFANSV